MSDFLVTTRVCQTRTYLVTADTEREARDWVEVFFNDLDPVSWKDEQVIGVPTIIPAPIEDATPTLVRWPDADVVDGSY